MKNRINLNGIALMFLMILVVLQTKYATAIITDNFDHLKPSQIDAIITNIQGVETNGVRNKTNSKFDLLNWITFDAK